MADPVRVYIVTHPEYANGMSIVDGLVEHLEDLAERPGGVPIPTRARSAPGDPADPQGPPAGVDLSAATASIVVMIAEPRLKAAFDGPWASFRDHLASAFLENENRTRDSFVMPLIVALDTGNAGLFDRVPNAGDWSNVQHIRAYDWDYPAHTPRSLNRILMQIYRLVLAALNEVDVDGDPVHRTEVFVSHAKADLASDRASGNRSVVDWLIDRANHTNCGIELFFDETDLAPGYSWKRQFERAIKKSALIAVTTDTYATRPVCRWELLTAKRHRRPVLDVNAVLSTEPLRFTGGGNVPSVRSDPVSRQDAIVDDLLLSLVSEVARHELWLRMAKDALGTRERHLLFSRPVELLDIAYAKLANPGSQNLTLVYPDPPLDEDQMEAIEALRPDNITIKPLSEVMP